MSINKKLSEKLSELKARKKALENLQNHLLGLLIEKQGLSQEINGLNSQIARAQQDLRRFGG